MLDVDVSVPAEQVAQDKPLILIVDDDAMNRAILGAMLRQLRYPFHIAANGQEAVEATRQQTYAAILMDCLMPTMDGYDATRQIRQEERAAAASSPWRHVPVIAVTAVAIQGARERCIAAGMDDYLSKPVVIQSVADVLDRWVADRSDAPAWTPSQDLSSRPVDDDVLDAQSLQDLRGLDPDNGDTFVAAVVQDFLADVTPRFATMRTQIERNDVPGLVQEFHSIAGCAAIVGATRVETLARSIQTVDAIAEPGVAGELVSRLEAAFESTRFRLETMVSTVTRITG
jgi:two-component system sensor histidine kinase/response regulator